jgi:hypothetical protein
MHAHLGAFTLCAQRLKRVIRTASSLSILEGVAG